MDSEIIIGVLKSLPLPAVVALVIAGAGCWKRAELGERRWRFAWVVGLGIAAGVVVGYWREGFAGWPLPPRQSMHWIPLVAAIGALGCFGVAMAGDRARLGVAIRRWASLLIVVGISWRKIRVEWSWYESLAWVMALGGVIAGMWAILDVLAGFPPRKRAIAVSTDAGSSPRVPAWAAWLPGIAWTGLTSQALAACDSLSLGTAMAILSACCGAAMLVSIVRPQASIAGGSGVIAGLVGMLVFSSYHYTDGLAWWMGMLLMLAPLAALAIDRLMPRRIGGWKRAIACTAGMCVLPGIVLAVAIPAAIAASEEAY